MAKAKTGSLFIALVAVASVYKLQQTGFVPPLSQPVRNTPVPAVAAAGVVSALLAAEPVFAKIESANVGNAARKLADAAYPLMTNIDWTKNPVFLEWAREAAWTPEQLATVVQKLLKAGIAMDPAYVKTLVEASERGVQDVLKNDRFLPPQDDVEEIFIAAARAIGSAGSEKAMGVFNAYREVGGLDFNNQMMDALGGPGEVGQTYKSFIDLIQVLQPLSNQ